MAQNCHWLVFGIGFIESGRQIYVNGFRHGVAPGSVSSFGTIPPEIQQLLDQITYGNEVSFTNNINQVSSKLGVVYLGLTTDRACETSDHLYSLIGSSTVRSGIVETAGRFYNPLCRFPSVNVAGGANSGGCNCIQLEPQPVTEEPVDKSHAVFKDVNTIYVDGREPLMIPFNVGLQYLEVGKLQKLRTENENKNHVFAYAIPNILDEAQNKVSGKIYFESSWTRFTNNYPIENQNNIEQGDTIQYAINIAKWLEPSPDISSETCIVDPDSSIGDWKDLDGNIATPSDNCCYEYKIGTIIDGGRFACIEG